VQGDHVRRFWHCGKLGADLLALFVQGRTVRAQERGIAQTLGECIHQTLDRPIQLSQPPLKACPILD
jgi:hypothetical protein